MPAALEREIVWLCKKQSSILTGNSLDINIVIISFYLGMSIVFRTRLDHFLRKKEEEFSCLMFDFRSDSESC